MLHRGKITVRLASGLVICTSATSILLVFSLKFVFITGLSPLRCEVSLVHVEIILIVLVLLLFVSCVALNAIVY